MKTFKLKANGKTHFRIQIGGEAKTYLDWERHFREEGDQRSLAKLRYKFLVWPFMHLKEGGSQSEISRRHGVSRKRIGKYTVDYGDTKKLSSLEDEGKRGRPTKIPPTVMRRILKLRSKKGDTLFGLVAVNRDEKIKTMLAKRGLWPRGIPRSTFYDALEREECGVRLRASRP